MDSVPGNNRGKQHEKRLPIEESKQALGCCHTHNGSARMGVAAICKINAYFA
jgi:hypothetical protein